ncbi:hypothetical protein MKEN_00581300 [Mycena kentingensis (nom. inval.)]|nr:hypothetical protein MKEN_00581300 [Mycena kentingensis (nom. inval.)]
MTTPVETAVSAKGREFTVTRPVPEDVASIMADGKEDFGIGVNWPAETAHQWHDTAQVVKDVAAITQYILTKTGPDKDGDYTCELTFTNTKHYKYYFYDQTGDSYLCNTFTNGTHKVGYYSKKPDIIFITGS